MSAVRVSYEGGEPAGSVVAAAEIINARLEVVAQLPVLAGIGQPIQLDEPGGHLVRGWLPSGQQLTATFEADADETVILRAPGTPAEPDAAASAGPPGPAGRALTWALTWALQSGRWEPVPTSVLDLGRDGVRLKIPPISSGSVIVQVGGALATRMTVIPATEAARVSVQPDRQSGAPGWRWRVDVPTDAGVVLLGYLENGDLRSARILAGAFLDMPAWANATPFLAAAAGYVLLRTGDHEKLCALTRQYGHALDEVPDGAVIRAWQQLHEPEPAFQDVRDLLLRAAARLPIASEGLRLLSRGLRLLARQQQDDAVRAALERIRPLAAGIALQTDPMTAFSGRAPAEPSLTPVTTSPADVGEAGLHAEPFFISSVLRSTTGRMMRWTQDSASLATDASGPREASLDTAPSPAAVAEMPDESLDLLLKLADARLDVERVAAEKGFTVGLTWTRLVAASEELGAQSVGEAARVVHRMRRFIKSPSVATEVQEAQLSEAQIAALVEALGVPPAAIQSVAASLLHKLERVALTGEAPNEYRLGAAFPAVRKGTTPAERSRCAMQVDELLKPFPIKEFHPFPRAMLGPGAHEMIGPEAKKLGFRKILVMTSGLRGSDTVHKIVELLKYHGLETVLFDKVESNPKDYNVMDAVALYQETKCDSFVSIGGGSSHDACKGARISVAHDGRSVNEFEGFNKSENPKNPPHIAVSTTAGTGSETSWAYVITDTTTDPDQPHKYVAFDDACVATLAIDDPVLYYDCPLDYTAQCGFDVLAHASEPYVSRLNFPPSLGNALYAIKLTAQNLRAAVWNGQDLPGREGMMYAQYIAAQAFNSGGLGIIHSISDAVSAFYDTHHGLNDAIALPRVWAFNMPVAYQRFADIADQMGVDTHGMTAVQAAEAALAAAIRLLRDVGIPEKFTDVTQDSYSKNRLGKGPTKYYENAKTITGDKADVDRITNHVLGDAYTPGNAKECTFETVRPVVDHCMNGDLDDLLS